ncbi:RNA polymerase sigma factor [Alkalicoccobacillus plakortidis]|uniref:RNA polymerase sigma factor n=1 Tax=Alkalicoccobacillus plakortidis TaxID=444060 RepID=A0ABT0XF14_9BACI|nr:sigma-70 family RNA polymerase sigma factor [Alkalicoccobacillus plakortidis]MCM2674491.1 RNA polymerase sigma factor [Alkalicoccobacillus plakortidis]
MSNRYNKEKEVNEIKKLIVKAKKGDEKSFLKIFQCYEKDIYRMAYLYVKNQNDALDVVQEVAYRSYKNISSLENPDYLKTWLIKIAITCSLNVINKNNKVVNFRVDHEGKSANEMEDVCLSIALQELIDLLDVEEKSVVILKYYEDYSFKEISEILNIPLGTAKSILYRALGKLRKELKGVDMSE